MGANFAVRLSDLRKEKKISQKEAASCLGVSQALLSHYEKGVRECGLDFLIRACRYYDVTSDYLLGISDDKRGLSDINSDRELPSDLRPTVKTEFRALVAISKELSEAHEKELSEELLLTVYRFALLSLKLGKANKKWFSIDLEKGAILAQATAYETFKNIKPKDRGSENAPDNEPLALKTVIEKAEETIKTEFLDGLN